MTKEDKARLVDSLILAFGKKHVHERQATVQLNLPSGKVDIVPRRGEFVPGGERPSPTDHFHNNPAGRQAVRAVKMHAEAQGLPWSGHRIEQAVIAHQKCDPNALNFQLANAAIESLTKNS